MAISNNHELYSSVREIAKALEDAGAQNLANELRQALTVSSMPGEVLGEVRLALQRVRSHEIYHRLNVRQHVDEGIEYVGRAFGE